MFWFVAGLILVALGVALLLYRRRYCAANPDDAAVRRRYEAESDVLGIRRSLAALAACSLWLGTLAIGCWVVGQL